MTTGERLIELRNKLGFSQEQMADELGVKRSTYAKWEKDTNQPTRKLKDIAAYFHVTTDYLLGNTDIPNEPPASAAAGMQALTPQDQELLRKYHELDSRGKQAVLDTLDREHSYTTPQIEDTAM
ncbi:helix-turn-helix domain-containing protein [uncultured Mitsuokella sp.]|uniref:helix-turn-helix domain-containing protein n=1 Tax=uncultured Mitsuokella sp. TaxID=453120 RepID=UPI002670298D|nr:helix-turn-helix transcriptional regulator [uncultured Mitsuokella sp.]